MIRHSEVESLASLSLSSVSFDNQTSHISLNYQQTNGSQRRYVERSYALVTQLIPILRNAFSEGFSLNGGLPLLFKGETLFTHPL